MLDQALIASHESVFALSELEFYSFSSYVLAKTF